MRLQLTGLLVVVLGCDGPGAVFEEPAAPDAAGSTGAQAGDSTGLGEGGAPSLDGSSGDAEPGSGSEPGADGVARTLVPLDATWSVSSSAPSDWASPGFDDGAWQRVQAPLGRGYAQVSAWPEPGSIFARLEFDAALEPGEPLELRLQRDDAARAYFDGELVAAWNVEGDGADDEVTGVEGHTFFVAQFDAPAGEGDTHVLAVEVLQATDPDAVFSARLRRASAGPGREEVVVQLRTRTRGGNYAPDNVGAVWLERADGTFVRTLGVWAGTRREHLLQWNARTSANMVDAVTSATAGAHHARVFTWDGTDAGGQVLSAGDYVLHAEFTEDNSNEGAPVGPTISVPFSTEARCGVFTGQASSFADVTIVGPCF